MNPRYPCEYAALAKRCFRPLSHLTGGPAIFEDRRARELFAWFARHGKGILRSRASGVGGAAEAPPARCMAGAWGAGTAAVFLPAMILPLLSVLLCFGGSFIVLTRVLLLSVRAVVMVTGAEKNQR